MDGVLPLFKERGMTSADCVAKVRHILHMRKVGHSGTLDPNVDGVLPICLGQATKIVNLLMSSGKTYTGEITLGFATTTEDLDGEVIQTAKLSQPFSNEQLDTVFQQMTGELIQIPPMYSAVKVHGKRLYEYARAGESVERPQRHITVTKFVRVGEPVFDAAAGIQKIKFEVQCSKGTYVRTLAVDFGKKLNVPAVMSQLTRQSSGGFTIANTVTLAQLATAVKEHRCSQVIWPLRQVLVKYPQVTLTEQQWLRVSNGAALRLTTTDANVVTLLYAGNVKALYQRIKPNYYKPMIMLLQNNGVNYESDK
ncbi:MAG: tRNA pseudouridine(55) synthase TruB [Candidatus Paralactobacillus gallistercoris]|uniref:tRNA pseudouridine synthase B n=1 Tax=Candidatus Paralactobacillus gallistercoris TaxID=2838724 RepID=A0A948TJB2_9LACO|nr:tRNA pseudouridine(55) synthase TruB [Candidatus Paralactobacillus gallistercoris]